MRLRPFGSLSPFASLDSPPTPRRAVPGQPVFAGLRPFGSLWTFASSGRYPTTPTPPTPGRAVPGQPVFAGMRPFGSLWTFASSGRYDPSQGTLRLAVYSRLSGLSAVVALVGVRIHPDHAPQSWDCRNGPCVVYTVPTWNPNAFLDGFDGTAVADVDIAAMAARKTDALAIEAAIRSSFVGFSGKIGVVEVDYITNLGRSADYVDPFDGSDEGYWTIDVRVEVGYRP